MLCGSDLSPVLVHGEHSKLMIPSGDKMKKPEARLQGLPGEPFLGLIVARRDGKDSYSNSLTSMSLNRMSNCLPEWIWRPMWPFRPTL